MRLGNKHCFSAPRSLLEPARLACAGKETENHAVPEKSFLPYVSEFRNL